MSKTKQIWNICSSNIMLILEYSTNVQNSCRNFSEQHWIFCPENVSAREGPILTPLGREFHSVEVATEKTIAHVRTNVFLRVERASHAALKAWGSLYRRRRWYFRLSRPQPLFQLLDDIRKLIYMMLCFADTPWTSTCTSETDIVDFQHLPLKAFDFGTLKTLTLQLRK